jgi:FtsZ-interacting cell division protein ZipA
MVRRKKHVSRKSQAPQYPQQYSHPYPPQQFQQAPPRPKKQVVKTYQSDFQRDAGIRGMSKKGWVVANVSAHLGNRPMGKKILIGFLAKQRTFYTVLYHQF